MTKYKLLKSTDHVGTPVRLQSVNPKPPCEKDSCVAKIRPRSYLIETESGNLYRRNRKFIRQDPRQEQASSYNSGTSLPSHAESPTESLPDAKADSPSIDCSQSPIFPWDRRCRLFSLTGPSSRSLDASETRERTKCPWVGVVGLIAWGERAEKIGRL